MNKTSGFPDIEEKLNKADYAVLERLQKNADFQHWRKLVEDFQMKRAYLFISGATVPEDVKDAHSYYRGGYDLHVKAMRIVDNSSDMLETLNNEDGQEENS